MARSLSRWLLVAGLAACSQKAPPPGPTVSGPEAGTAGTATDDAAATPTAAIADDTRQLVTAVVGDWDRIDAELRLWTRAEAGAPWRLEGAPWPATVGRTGVAWGRGLHGEGAPARRGGPVKREGDGKSPAGLFAIGPAFGYAAAPPAGARLPYTAVDVGWRCVDDPASAFYNRILDERTVTPDWTSAEHMRRDDALYAWVVELRHNEAATPGGGSCIFLHVWGGPGDATVGCTAMEEPRLAALVATLDPAAHPVFALLTAADYDALAAAWRLPPR